MYINIYIFISMMEVLRTWSWDPLVTRDHPSRS